MSRLIDEMTSQEIETLHLKGMLTTWKGDREEHELDLEHESREAEAQRETDDNTISLSEIEGEHPTLNEK